MSKKITVTLERVEGDKYQASLPFSGGMPMVVTADTPGLALEEIGNTIDMMMIDAGWEEMIEKPVTTVTSIK